MNSSKDPPACRKSLEINKSLGDDIYLFLLLIEIIDDYSNEQI